MRPYLLLIAALAACFDDTEPPPPAPDADAAAKAAKAAKAKAAPAKKTFDEKLADVQARAVGGDAAGALPEAEALLAEKPEDDRLWVLVEALAIASGDPGAVLDRLDAPAGGRAGPHHLLRAHLALAADRPADALAAAQAAMAAEPDAAAALVAMAARAGATLPETDGDGVTPAESLARWATAKDARAARGDAEAAQAVAGWRAAVLRGDVHAARGDAAAALSEYAAAAGATDSRAVTRGNLGRAGLVDAPDTSNVDRATWSAAAVTSARDGGLVHLLPSALSVAAEAHLAAVQASEAVALIEPSFRAAVAAEDSAAIGVSGVRLARVALAAGAPALAAEAAGAAREALAGGDAELLQQAAWAEVWATWTLGRVDAARAAADAVTGARKPAADALALASAGQLDAAADRMSLKGLAPADAARAAQASALLQPSRAVPHLEAAVKAAAASKDRALLLQSRLQLEEAARARGLSVAARVRSDLTKSAAAGAAGDGLRAEVAARSLISGGSADLATAPAAWQALSRKATTTDTDAVTAAVGSWASGRAGAASGDAAAAVHYGQALARLPLHRHGALSSGTALDGSHGFDLETDLQLLVADAADVGALAAGLAVQEAGHRLDVARADLRARRMLAAELPAEHGDALLGAAAAARAGMLRYQAGAGPLPVEAFEALTKAEAAAGAATVSLKRILPAKPPSMGELRRALDGAALLSYTVGPSQVYGLALTNQGGAIRMLGSSRDLRVLAGRHRAALEAAAGAEAKAAHSAGDGLRRQLIDPFMGDLSGFGRYLVLAPSEVFTFQFTTLPEQADGLRWLAAIRTLSMAPDVRSIRIPPEKPSEEQASYNPDFLGLGSPEAAPPPAQPGAEEGAPANADQPEPEVGGTTDEDLLRRHRANTNMPLDLGAASRQFGADFRQILVGTDASGAKWGELVKKARYIHISEVEPAGDGGFALADGDLSLATIRTTPIRAQLVIITAEGPAEVQLSRARAFLDAGAESVMVSTWSVPAKIYDRLFDGFYEAINRDRTAAASAREARESLLRTSLNEYEQDDPADWGSMVLYSLP